jgi:hypothetical protein
VRRREHQGARALGGKRTARVGEAVADISVVTTKAGHRFQADCKIRKKLPHIVTSAWEQCRRYCPAATPLAVIFRPGMRGGIVAIDLDAFAHIVGLDVAQFPPPRPLRRKHECQVEMFEVQP